MMTERLFIFLYERNLNDETAIPLVSFNCKDVLQSKHIVQCHIGPFLVIKLELFIHVNIVLVHLNELIRNEIV